jgi:hypothetical protein
MVRLRERWQGSNECRSRDYSCRSKSGQAFHTRHLHIQNFIVSYLYHPPSNLVFHLDTPHTPSLITAYSHTYTSCSNSTAPATPSPPDDPQSPPHDQTPRTPKTASPTFSPLSSTQQPILAPSTLTTKSSTRTTRYAWSRREQLALSPQPPCARSNARSHSRAARRTSRRASPTPPPYNQKRRQRTNPMPRYSRIIRCQRALDPI